MKLAYGEWNAISENMGKTPAIMFWFRIEAFESLPGWAGWYNDDETRTADKDDTIAPGKRFSVASIRDRDIPVSAKHILGVVTISTYSTSLKRVVSASIRAATSGSAPAGTLGTP